MNVFSTEQHGAKGRAAPQTGALTMQNNREKIAHTFASHIRLGTHGGWIIYVACYVVNMFILDPVVACIAQEQFSFH